ncbi:MAG: DnaJ family domain-containing protein [Pseudomonadota bacterium]
MLIDRRAEALIQQAVDRGELDNLPGSGESLHLDDDTMVPVELRAAHRLLKNSGFVPVEIQVRRDINSVEQLLSQLDCGSSYAKRARQKLLHLQLQLERARGAPSNLLDRHSYAEQLQSHLE